MQKLTGTGYQTSEQHVESPKARTDGDTKDNNTLLDFLKERSPFTDEKTLRNIKTRMVADSDVNVDNAREFGEKIVNGIAGQTISEISFEKERSSHYPANKKTYKFMHYTANPG